MKKQTFNDFSKGIGNSFPFLYAAYGVDLTQQPNLMVANQMSVDEDDNGLASISEINWFNEHNNSLYALTDGGNLLIRSSGTWGLKKALGVNHTRGMASFLGDLYVALNDDVDKSIDGGDNFTSDWWTGAGGSGLDVTTYHPLTEVQGKLLIGDKQAVHHWDGTTATSDALTLPDEYIIIDIIKTPYYAGIIANKGGQGRLFLWDTTSAQVNYSFSVPNRIVGGYQIQGNTYVLDTKGNLYVHDGDRMVIVAKIPDLEQKTSTSIIKSKPQCMTLENDELLMAVDLGSVGTDERAWSGVWSYNLKTSSIHFKYYISTKEIYQISLGAIYNYQNSIYLSTTEKATQDINIEKTGTSYDGHSKGAFVIIPMNNDGRKKRLVKHVIDYILDTTTASSGTSITVSYSDTGKYIIGQAANSGTANNSFTTATDVANEGDMVMVMSGARAGDVSFITGESGSYVYTVSPNFSGALASGDIVGIFPFKKLGTIDDSTDNDTISKMFRNTKLVDDYMLRLDFKLDQAGSTIDLRGITNYYNELKN